MLNRKERMMSITLDMGKPVPLDAVSVTPHGELTMYYQGQQVKPVKATLETSYPREKKPKVIHKADIPIEVLKTDIHAAFQRYDRLYVIDTNTRIINGEKISVACILLAKFRPGGDMTLAFFAPVHALEFWGIEQKPENIAWREAILAIQANPEYKDNLKIGILVDSDLGEIPNYNLRLKPIVGDFYLPQYFELIYASADVGKEYFVNKLISDCDKESQKIFNLIETAPSGHPSLEAVPNKEYSHFRLWNRA